MRPNALKEFGLRFLVLLIVLNNIVKCNKKALNSNDYPYNIEIDNDMSYMDLYACLNQDDFPQYLIDKFNYEGLFNGSLLSNLNSKIIYICKNQPSGNTSKNLSYLLDSILNNQMNNLLFPKNEIEFIDI